MRKIYDSYSTDMMDFKTQNSGTHPLANNNYNPRTNPYNSTSYYSDAYYVRTAVTTQFKNIRTIDMIQKELKVLLN